MKFSLAKKFAFLNLKANRKIEIPFVLSSTVMFILFFITTSLVDNDYVKTRHKALIQLIIFAVVIVAIFTFVFVIYATNFLLKKRNKEFALYGILGLEKKHIRKIIRIEFFILFFIITILAIFGGYIFGKFTFLILNKLMKDVSGRIMDYTFSKKAMLFTIILSFILYLITVLRSGLKIFLLIPVKLLQKEHSGEGEPKSRIFIMILGFLTLFVAYYMALTIKGVLSSLLYFFLAALLVMFATYLLFISFSIIFLKLKKKSESYYKPSNFLKISGLLYRMKSNATSLATISILSTGIIITLATTITIYENIEQSSKNVMPREYQIQSEVALNENNYKLEAKKLKDDIFTTVDKKEQIKNEFTTLVMMSPIIKKDNEFIQYDGKTKGIPNFLICYDIDSYNMRTGKDIKLKKDEVLICSNSGNIINMNKIKIGDMIFKTEKVENIIPSNFAVDVYLVVVNNFETMQYISKNLKTLNYQNKKLENSKINCLIDWDIEGISEEDYKENIINLQNKNGYEVNIQKDYLDEVYGINGGFIFLGVIVSLIFITGAILITYYKQINEGYEDREKYQIMKNIGLSDELIKKSISSQIVLMFILPIVVAAINSFVASKIVFQLLGMFAVKSYMQYATFLMVVIFIFFLVYFIIFKITSREYYKIVN